MVRAVDKITGLFPFCARWPGTGICTGTNCHSPTYKLCRSLQ